MNQFIPSVNFHLWEPCNMRCKFCFATFQDVKQSVLPKGHLPKGKAIEVVQALAKFGFEKITFAGGEPTLCPWLTDLTMTAKQMGMTTMIVTNGSNLSDAFLIKNQPYLDWIAISIDSLKEQTNLNAGRAICGKKVLSAAYYMTVAKRVKKYGYRLKINTVVNRENYQENLSGFLAQAKPERWKVLQVLAIKGQNDEFIDDFSIHKNQFQSFLDTHADLGFIVPESTEDIKASYVMVDPAGRFFHNKNGQHEYSQPINEVGVSQAIKEMEYDFEKFMERGGIYDW